MHHKLIFFFFNSSAGLLLMFCLSLFKIKGTEKCEQKLIQRFHATHWIDFPIVLFLIGCNTSNASRHVLLLTCCTCMITFHTGDLLLLCTAQLDWLPEDVWNITQHHMRYSLLWNSKHSFCFCSDYLKQKKLWFYFKLMVLVETFYFS